MPRSSSAPVTCPATADMQTAWPVLIGVLESNTTMLSSDLAARLRECVTSGDETQ